MKLKGLYTALVTPFNDRGELDQRALIEQIHAQIQNKVDGIVILGTTGESPTLTDSEKKLIIQIARRELTGKARLIIGTGSNSTAQTITATRQAHDAGADAALIITPYYNRPSQEGIYRHFEAICSSTSLPVCLYNHPGRTGRNIETATMKRLSEIPGIIGVKEASGDLSQMGDVIAEIALKNPNFCVLSGDDSLTLPLIAMGGHGVISVISNLLPQEFKALVQCALEGNFVEARNRHYSLLPLIKALSIDANPIPIKAAMNLMGMSVGSCRLPLCDLDTESLEKLASVCLSQPMAMPTGCCSLS